MMKNQKYFPKTSEVIQDSKRIGLKDYKEFYKITNLIDYLNEIFAEEYRTYIKNEIYFPGCPLKIYIKTFQDRLEDYQLIYPDADEFDFLKHEDTIISRLFLMDADSDNNFYSFYKWLYPDPHWKNFNMSFKKTRFNFIDTRIKELDHFFYVTGVDPIDYDKVPRELFKLRRNPNARNIDKPKLFEYRKPTLEKFSYNPNAPEKSIEKKLSALETAYLAYYFIKSGEYNLGGEVESRKDWEYFSELAGGASIDNIRKSYKDIEYKESQRLKASRLSKIQNTVSFIENNYPDKDKVLQIALSDLQAVERKNV